MKEQLYQALEKEIYSLSESVFTGMPLECFEEDTRKASERAIVAGLEFNGVRLSRKHATYFANLIHRTLYPWRFEIKYDNPRGALVGKEVSPREVWTRINRAVRSYRKYIDARAQQIEEAVKDTK